MVAAACLFIAACDAPESGDAVIRTDSAGVEIVESRSPAWQEDEGWLVADTPVFEIGAADGDTTQQLFQVRGARRRADGSIAVLNSGTNEVRIYSATGEYLRSIGRAGAGPGELRTPMHLWITTGDSVVVADLGRVSVFDPAGNFVRALAFGMAFPRDRFPDGTLLGLAFAPGQDPAVLGQSRPRVAITRYAPGAIADTLAELAGDDVYRVSFDGSGIANFRVPFGHQRLLVLHDGRIYTTDGSRFDVAVFDDAGTLIRRVRNTVQPGPVTARDIEKYESGMLDRARSDDQRRRYASLFREWTYPSTLPACDRLVMDEDGAIWLRHFQLDDTVPSVWTVFADDGRWLGEVTLPADLEVSEITRDLVIGIRTDDPGVEYVRGYSVDRR